ncbi:Carboxypeptidase regulatory-like domain containing protein [Caulobacteraceae bacterium]
MSILNRLARTTALTALGFALVAPVAVYAQETTGTIRGQIAASGAPVTGAAVTIIHTPSGSRARATTDSSGQFSASGLRAGGPYTVEVTADTYEPTVVNDLFLTVTEPFSLALNLVPADKEVERIIVRATAVGRNRVDGTATGLRRDKIEGLVTPGRDIRELARQSPLVTQNTVGDGGISIAGSNPRTNRITIDGVAAQDDFGLNTGGLPTRRGPISLDAVSQFNVTPAPFDVRNGGFLGGAIDIVLRSGDNELGGSVFANFLDDKLTGTRIKNTIVSNVVEQTNYGATLRGPIIKDKLFYALSYEKYESVDVTNRGPIDGGSFGNSIVGPLGAPMTLADIAAVTNVFANTYKSNFAFGSIPTNKPILDEKYSARIDWNITDKHRASFTYRNAESTVYNFTNLGATTASLDSQWYFTGELDETYSLQLNSDWNDKFQTEARISYRDYVRLQQPPSGQEFADITVCSTLTSLDATGSQPLITCAAATGQSRGVVRFGPDQFRHANFLATTNTQGQFEARYRLGDHQLKAGLQWQERDIFNLFVPNSDGTYYFDSVADFQAGRANRLQYTNNPSGDPNKAAAEFTYQILSGYLQDTWSVTDDFRLTGGLRVESYSVDGAPAANANFSNRFGFTNQATYDGLSIVMPRVSFNWNAPADIRVSGGVGLFSGGLPDVFLSNSFSNTGVLTVGVDIQRTATGFTETGAAPGFTNAIGSLALDNLVGANFGRAIPAQVLALLGGVTPPPAAETNSIAPNLDIPSEWKANLAVTGEAFGLNLGLDLVYTKVQTGYAFRDLRATPLIINGQQALTPDGRKRYDAIPTPARAAVPGAVINSTAPVGGSNRDIQLYNPDGDLGDAFIAAISASKSYDFGINWSMSYTLQNINELNSTGRFSSTASSLYGGALSALDPANPVTGRGQEEIENVFKYSFGWRATPFKELETRLELFGDVRAGRPFSWLMNTGSGRSIVTGVNKGGQLAYIPDLSGTTSTSTSGAILVSSDSKVAFDSQATFDAVKNLINNFGLPAGQIAPRGFNTNDQIHLLDMRISQELPGAFEGHKGFLTFDFQNVLNMINEDWGVVEEYGDQQTLYTAACADATGAVNNTGTVLCNRYRITNPSTILTNPKTRNVDRSRWQIQVGVRYEF